jgi:hypothetical protein
MRSLRVLCLLLIAPGVIRAQSNPQKPDSPPNNSDVATELKTLREALMQTQRQVADQQREIETLKARSNNSPASSAAGHLPPTESETSHDLTSSSVEPTPEYTAAYVRQQPAQQDQEKTSPVQGFKIGDAVLTPGGFVDLENIFRTTNTQSNIATSFASIPYSNTPQGNISEFRTTAQYSRLNLMVKDKYHGNDITGYVEGDFSGNDAPGVYQSVNPHTNRLRLYFGDFKRGKWEFLGGQTWSWLTPNRTGIGPIPADLAITYNEDQNIGVGLPYTRAAELRVAYHVNEHWAMGVGIENSNQFIGNFVALPAAFSSMVGPQFDNGAQIGAANAFPDILSKVTYDHDFSGRHFHAEAAGLVTGAHASVKPVGEDSFKQHSTVGGGGQIAANYELLPKLTLLANAFWSDGGAHYLVATGPQLVVRPNALGTDISLSMVHAGAGSVGLEWRASEKEAFAVYYGADYYGRNFFPDTSNTAEPGTIIGYGGPGSANTNNRAIQQATFDWLQTFWKDTRYGALQSYVQYSYLTRAPWFVVPDTPKNAHLSMVYFGVRYVLPSTSGTLLRVPYPN